jgi:hypothetical protein
VCAPDNSKKASTLYPRDGADDPQRGRTEYGMRRKSLQKPFDTAKGEAFAAPQQNTH